MTLATDLATAAQPAEARPAGRDRALDEVEAAFSLMARKAGLPRMHERFSAAAGVDLEPSSFHLLRRLEQAEPVRASDLAVRAGLDLSTVSRQVAALEAAGLLERARDPQDGRASLLTLSERGRQASARVCEARTVLFGEFLTDWPDEDIERFADMLRRFAHAMAAFAEYQTGAGRPPRPEKERQ